MAEAGSGDRRRWSHTDLAITGKPAQFGRGVMQDVSDKLLHQFVACLEQRMGEEDTGGAAAPAAAAPSAPAPAAEPAAPTETAVQAAPAMAAEEAVAAETPEAPAPPPHPPYRLRQAEAARPRGSDDALNLGSDGAADPGQDLLEACACRGRGGRSDHLDHRQVTGWVSGSGVRTPLAAGGSERSSRRATRATTPQPATSCQM